MLGKITLFQYASMCWVIIDPTTQIPPFVLIYRANNSRSTVDVLVNVKLMSGSQHRRVANKSNHHMHMYLTLANRLMLPGLGFFYKVYYIFYPSVRTGRGGKLSLVTRI